MDIPKTPLFLSRKICDGIKLIMSNRIVYSLMNFHIGVQKEKLGFMQIKAIDNCL